MSLTWLVIFMVIYFLLPSAHAFERKFYHEILSHLSRIPMLILNLLVLVEQQNQNRVIFLNRFLVNKI